MRPDSENHFDLRRCVPMSRQEEHRCAIAYGKSKDPVLAERLVMANMRLVVTLAHQYCRVSGDLRDMVQEGNRGLIRAVRGYDPNRNIRFCTYAAWWIRAYMLQFTLNNWRLVKVGTTQVQRKLFFSLRKERRRLELTGAEATPRELALRLRVKESEVATMMERFASSEISLDAPIAPDGLGARTIGDTLSDPSASRPDRWSEDTEFADVLRSKLKIFGEGLQGREAEIFRGRLVSDEPLTLTQLAATFGVTRERTRQVEQRLKLRIRDYLADELGDELDLPEVGRGRQHHRGALSIAGRPAVRDQSAGWRSAS
ncbi:MAG TPA: sigma-70 family RNA polymerase sigma factor [Polyangia bacterium]|nr:sigma-70 family RNA polymerase sigma factor [Polyangia bacterium]